jgi:non-specific serine/threonine protein kinase
MDSYEPKQIQEAIAEETFLDLLLRDGSCQWYKAHQLPGFFELVLASRIPLFLMDKKCLLPITVTSNSLCTIHCKVQLKNDLVHFLWEIVEHDGAYTLGSVDSIFVLDQSTPCFLVVNQRLLQVGGAWSIGAIQRVFRNASVSTSATQMKGAIIRWLGEVPADTFKNNDLIDFKTCTTPSKSIIQWTHDFMSGQHGLILYFSYAGTSIDYRNKKSTIQSVNGIGPEVEIIQIVRNTITEKIMVHHLKRLGLNEGMGFQIKGQENDLDALLAWLQKHKGQLTEVGIEVPPPVIDHRPVSLDTPLLKANYQLDGDWFDMKGTVYVGSQHFPFAHLFDALKQGNRWFLLDDGTWMHIPAEWFSRYAGMLALAQKEFDKIVWTRSQYYALKAWFDEEADYLDWMDESDIQAPKSLRCVLRPYQLEGLRWLVQHYRKKLGACLADDMGLGKTLQTIALLLYVQERNAKTSKINLGALLVVPASLVDNWGNEIKKFGPSLSIYNHTGPGRTSECNLWANYDVVITTYQTLYKDQALFEKTGWRFIILDESQAIKNNASKIFKAVKSLHGLQKISLSGTPIENSLGDLWSQMDFINPGLLPPYRVFKETYQIPIEKRKDIKLLGFLKQLVDPFLLRRTKAAVTPDLPAVDILNVFVHMSEPQRKVYEKERSSARNLFLEETANNEAQLRMMVLAALTKLRQIVNHPIFVNPEYSGDSGKWNEVMYRLEALYRNGHKVLVFSSFKKSIHFLQSWALQNKMGCASLTGDSSQEERSSAVRLFQEDEATKIFFISLKAGGTGLNLTAADYVFLLDTWWNPAAEQQAISRAHRIGQTKKVTVFKFITADSIEERILAMQEKKNLLAASIMDADFNKWSVETLKNVLGELSTLSTPEGN